MDKSRKKPFNLEFILDLFSKEMSAALVCLDLNRNINYLNEAGATAFGWRKDQAISQNFSKLCQQQSIEDICLKYLPKDHFESPVLDKIYRFGLDNKVLAVYQWSFFPIKEIDDETTGILMIGSDLRKNLQNKNTYLYSIINNIPHFVFWKDRHSVFLGCNKPFAKSAQLNAPEDIVGLTDYDLPWKKSESDSYRADDQMVMCTDQPKLLIEEQQTFENGEEMNLLTSKVPLHDRNGQVTGVLGIYADITELKKTQAALRKAEDQVEGMTIVSAAIAHELRTPLGSIAMGAQGIKKNLQSLIKAYQLAKKQNLPIKTIPSEQLEILSTVLSNIRAEANQANMVISMLLANLSVRKNRPQKTERLSMTDYLTKALNQYVFPPGKRSIVHEDLGTNFLFFGDEGLFLHIIFNLLKNALYFIDKVGKGEIYIWLESYEAINELHFKDTAQGIREEDLPHIFEQFFTKGTHHGTGIGLAFCKAVMESWGGKIFCRSIYGEYTEFICQFPKKGMSKVS